MRGWPKKFTLRGRTWSLTDQLNLATRDGAYGVTLVEDQSIALDSRPLNNQQHAETVVHELLHACYSCTSLPHVIGEDERARGENEETIVDSLAPAILSLIVDNPELIEKLQELYSKD